MLLRKLLFTIILITVGIVFHAAFSSPVFADRCTTSGNCIPDNICNVGGQTCTPQTCTGPGQCATSGGIPLLTGVGVISPPPGITKPFCEGLVPMANNFLRLMFIISGLWGFVNLIIAGFTFMQAGGDPKKIEQAWAKIWQSFVGLLILVSSFIIAGLIGLVLFGNPTYILNPQLSGAGTSPCAP